MEREKNIAANGRKREKQSTAKKYNKNYEKNKNTQR